MANKTKTVSSTKERSPTRGIIPCISFDNECEDALDFYVRLFPNSRILSVTKSDGTFPVPKGKVLHAEFELRGEPFQAMDGGPEFTKGMGLSLFVNCATQADVDHLYNGLAKGGGQKQPCGWVKDQFGVSWQIVPDAFVRMMSEPKAGNTKRMFEELLTMTKIDIAALEKAYKSK